MLYEAPADCSLWYQQDVENELAPKLQQCTALEVLHLAGECMVLTRYRPALPSLTLWYNNVYVACSGNDMRIANKHGAGTHTQHVQLCNAVGVPTTGILLNTLLVWTCDPESRLCACTPEGALHRTSKVHQPEGPRPAR